MFRIDHYLGKETVQNLMALRFANALFEPLWNRNFIDHVQITAAENIGIEGRADYYERAGALRDLVQNHLLQLLALADDGATGAFEANRLRNEKLKVLEAIAPPAIADVPSMAVRGSTALGLVGGAVPGLPARKRASHRIRRPRHTPRCGSRLELALGGRAVLPAHGQAACTQA